MTAGAPTLERRQARLGWLFSAPAALLLAAVALYPLGQTFWYSFTDARIGDTHAPDFVGLANFRELLGQHDFWRATLNTLVFAGASVSLEFVLGLALALAVNAPFRGRGLMRGAMLIPWALPTVVGARIWAWMLNDQFGVINDLLVRRLHLLAEPIAWTGTPGFAMASVIMVDVWKTAPFMALLLLAGLQLIPEGLYEAADVDGASEPQQFLAITLPMLKPTILVALVFRTLDALRVFDAIWVLTGGQFGTESLGTYNYRQTIEFQRLGYGSAVSVAIFAVIAIFIFLYIRLIREES